MAIVATAASAARAPADYGVALVDLSTGEFDVAEYAGPKGLRRCASEIAVLRPREIVVAAGYDVAAAIPEIAQIGAPITEIDGWHFELESARQTLLDQLRVQSLEGFGLERRQAAVCAGGALVRHLRDTQKAELAHVRSIRLRQLADGLLIDPTTLKHLEIVQAMDGGRSGSLLDEIDRTVTPMGCRLLRTWLLRPLTALEPIRDRLDAVEELAVKTTERGKARETLKSIQDLERLIARIALSTAGPRDLMALSRSLAAVPRAGAAAERMPGAAAAQPDRRARRSAGPARSGSIRRSPTSRRRWRATAASSATASITEVDDLRRISRSGKQVIAEMEEGERARTGIKSLKVGFNRVFGYFIEVSKSNLHAVPADLHPQADDCRRRALHHAGAEGIRREGARRRRAHRDARARDLRDAAPARRRRIAARARYGARGGRHRRAGRARRNRDGLQLHQAARARRRRDRRRPTSAIPWSSGWPAARSCRTTSS